MASKGINKNVKSNIEKIKNSKKGSYAKNVARSLKNLSGDVLKHLDPNLSDTISENTTYVKESYQSTKTTIREKDPFTNIKNTGAILVKNLVSQLKSGEFYKGTTIEDSLESFGISNTFTSNCSFTLNSTTSNITSTHLR